MSRQKQFDLLTFSPSRGNIWEVVRVGGAGIGRVVSRNSSYLDDSLGEWKNYNNCVKQIGIISKSVVIFNLFARDSDNRHNHFDHEFIKVV